jgi:hypothetical protein
MKRPPVNVYTLTDEDRRTLQALQASLWPKEAYSTSSKIRLDPYRVLAEAELEQALDIVGRHNLLTEMICTSMFGGVGMDIYEHEVAPETGPIFLLRLIEGHLPDKGPDSKKAPGGFREDAWRTFSKFTHSQQNARWLKSYKMSAPRDRAHFVY